MPGTFSLTAASPHPGEPLDPGAGSLDRLTHHVHILEMNGESCRLRQGKGSRKRPSSARASGGPAMDGRLAEGIVALGVRDQLTAGERGRRGLAGGCCCENAG